MMRSVTLALLLLIGNSLPLLLGCSDETADPRTDSVTVPPPGEELVLEGRHLIYANTYRTKSLTGDDPREYVKIGWYSFKAGGAARIEYAWYDARAERKPWETPIDQSPMVGVPYPAGCTPQCPPEDPGDPAAGGCAPGPIRIPGYTEFKKFDGSWSFDGTTLSVRVGTVTHEWVLEDKNFQSFLLCGYKATATGLPIIEGRKYGNFIGYGFVSGKARITAPISWGQFLPGYDGVAWATGEEGGEWEEERSSFNFSSLLPGSDPNVYSLAQESDNCTCSRRGTEWQMWLYRSMLINYAPVSKLFVYYHSGHDYNCDGCANEYGHTLQWLCATAPDGQTDSIRAIVRLEHSWQKDKFPLLSIGRYYDPTQELTGYKECGVVTAPTHSLHE